MHETAMACHAVEHHDEPAESSLLQAALCDPREFRLLYEQYRDRVYWYMRARTATREDAEDLLQQVFLQALDRLSQYNPKKGPFVGWLFGIARHLASNQRRAHRTVSWDLIPDVLRPASNDNPESLTLHRESVACLADIFAALDPKKRELLVLRYIVGLSFLEIGAATGKSEASARQQVSRTLRALKEQSRENT